MLFADATLARRLERNEASNLAEFTEAWAALRPEAGIRLAAVGEGYASFSGVHSPTNKVVGLGTSQPVTQSEVAAVEAFFEGTGCPAAFHVTPYTHPSLLALLGERGYRVAGFFNILARALPQSLSEGGEALPLAVRLVEAVTSAEKEAWVELAGRDGSPADNQALPFARIAAAREGVRLFAAWLGDEAVGIGALMLRDGVGTLFSASTRPAFRGQGVQQALIQARLRAASEAGCDTIMVMTVPGNGSQRNIERAGFRVAFTKSVLVQPPLP